MMQDFKNWLSINCSSKNTVNTYYNIVSKYFRYYRDIDQLNLNDYFSKLVEKDISSNTINLISSAFRMYFQYSKQTLELPKFKKPDKRINKYFTKDELTHDILPYIDSIFPKQCEKIKLIFKFLFLTGIRKSELINLKRSNINFDKQELELINTKGDCDRMIPFDKVLSTQLKSYFDIEPEVNNAFNISKGILENWFLEINNKLRFRLSLSPKLFRHSGGMYLVPKIGLTNVQKLFGHKDIKTTMIYIESDFKAVKSEYIKNVKGF